MSLPARVSETLLRFGVAADTLAAADDLHGLLGDGIVDALAALVESEGWAPAAITPADLVAVRAWLGRRYLDRHHAEWTTGRPTPGFWRDRTVDRGTGVAIPLGLLEAPGDGLLAEVAAAAGRAAGPDQPAPRGLVVLSRNTHVGNHPGSFAVDLVPVALAEAQALNAASGRQHTLPGSVGQTSGRAVGDPGVALVWEVQPNIYKPSRVRNRAAGAAYRRHRTWPLATTAAALAWLRDRGYETFVLDGSALRATHEVDPQAPLGDAIASLHDRTIAAAAAALDLRLRPPAEAEVPAAVRDLAKLGLGEELRTRGAAACLRRVESA